MTDLDHGVLVLPLPQNDELANRIASRLGWQTGKSAMRHFPDGESSVRVETPVAGRDIVLACTLDRPDDKLLPLYFLASTLRELDAARVILVAPYLAYMRQDRSFHQGEGVSARQFARLISGFVDGLVTVDPHLHRIHSLGEVYTIPATVVHAAPAVSDWIRVNVQNPVLIGPDSESRQWVSELAARAQAPFTVLQKTRRGDRDVEVSAPDVERWHSHLPVLFDDIISTGRTMIETIGHLRRLRFRPPVCIGVHGIFSTGAFADLTAAGVAQVVTCNTVPHPSNGIDVTPLLAAAVREMLGGRNTA